MFTISYDMNINVSWFVKFRALYCKKKLNHKMTATYVRIGLGQLVPDPDRSCLLDFEK